MAASSLAKQTCCDHRSRHRNHGIVPILSAASLSRFSRLLGIATWAATSMISACKHRAESAVTKGVEEALPGWLDLTTKADSKTRTPCPDREKDVKDSIQCAFKDKVSGLVWRGQAPAMDGSRQVNEFLTWSAAKSACEGLGRWAGFDGWRLPTESELSGAFLSPGGGVRRDGLLRIMEARQSFGAIPKNSFVWSLSEDQGETKQARALIRDGVKASIGTVPKNIGRIWLCVHSTTTNIAISALRPSGTLNDTTAPLPEDVRPGDIKGKSLQLQWGLVGHIELDGLAFVPMNSEKSVTPTNSSPPVTAPSPNTIVGQGEPNYLPSNSGLHPDRAPIVPSFKNRATIPQPTPPSKQRKNWIRSGRLPEKYVQALHLAFDKSGYHHAIDNDGHLVLNEDSGVTFASGSTEMTNGSQEMAQQLLRLYSETLLIGIAEESHQIRISIKGYTNPRPDSTNPSTQHANRRISRKRSIIIRNLLRDTRILPNAIISIEGRGEDNPIPRADRQTGPCGIYDCERSRRVELEAIVK